MNKNKVITYSLLAHINNSRTLSTGLLDLFVPLVKQALSDLSKKGTDRGGNIIEIKGCVDERFGLDIPIPILKRLLRKIQSEVNNEEKTRLYLYNDGAYSLLDYEFDEYDEVISKKQTEIESLENLFRQFCEANKVTKTEYTSIFDFINRNKLSIAKYLSIDHLPQSDGQGSLLIEAKFTQFFRKSPEVYGTIRNIYLGSIISTYIEYRTDEVKSNIELLFDTNFIIGLLDLNTPESSHTCNKLIEIGKGLGYKLSIMDSTIVEIQSLLRARAEYFDTAYLVRKINREDIYNACDRRGLTKTDLQRIADKLEDFLSNVGIYKIPNTDKYKNIARHSKEFESLKQLRHSDRSALHDASAIHYVKEKRGRPVYVFEEVNCWFVHNSINSVNENFSTGEARTGKPLSENIKVDDLLNILWLTNPGFSQSLKENDLTDFGLNALISSTLSDALPKAALIRDLDKNINKYVSDSTISADDIIRIATRISNREFADIEELNKLEETNPKEFIQKIKQASEEQEAKEIERAKKLDELLSELTTSQKIIKAKEISLEEQHNDLAKRKEAVVGEIEKVKEEHIELRKNITREKQLRLTEENNRRKKDRDTFINNKIKNWRLQGWFELIFCLLIFFLGATYFFWSHNWSLTEASKSFKEAKENLVICSVLFLGGLVLNVVVIKSLVDKYRNHSNIKAYRELIKIPDELTELKTIEDLK